MKLPHQRRVPRLSLTEAIAQFLGRAFDACQRADLCSNPAECNHCGLAAYEAMHDAMWLAYFHPESARMFRMSKEPTRKGRM